MCPNVWFPKIVSHLLVMSGERIPFAYVGGKFSKHIHKERLPIAFWRDTVNQSLNSPQ